MSQRTRRFFSLLLVAAICLTTLQLTTFADDTAEKAVRPTVEDVMAGLASPEELYPDIDAATVPDIIGADTAAERGHIKRLYEDEGDNLNQLIFLNADGTKTLYLYDHPVKFADASGKIKDISLQIAGGKVNGEYKTQAGASDVTFSRLLSDGIRLQGNGESISLTPKLPGENGMLPVVSAAAQKLSEKSVAYTYDAKTSIEYSLTYTGFKEDIVVSEYTGQTEYDFTLRTGGLKLVEKNGSYVLIDEDGNIKATLGDIIVFTADERNNTFGRLSAKTVTECEEYTVTIILDADYLADEKTAYPIRIDPTVEITYENNGAGAIHDVTLNSLTDSSPTSASIFVGKRQEYGIARVLMKFPGLNLNSLGSNITITNATVEIRDVMCEGSEMNVSCYVFAGNEWDENTVEWANVSPNSYSTFLSSNVISFNNGYALPTHFRYSFDITSAVQDWKLNSSKQNKGIMFKADSSVENASTYEHRTFAAYNRGEHRPSLSITYNVTGNIPITADCDHLAVGQTKVLNATVYPADINVTWSSSNPNVATVNSAGVVTGVSEGTAKITAKYAFNAVYFSGDFYVHVYDSIGIKDNIEYYVMNYSSKRYLSLESASDANLTNVYTRARSTSTLSQWKTEKQTDGTFQLISVNSSTGKVLDKTGTNIDIYPDYSASYQKFNVYRINSGTYKGLYYIRHGDYYVAQDSDYNVYLTTTANSSAVWSFMAVNQRYAELFCHDYTYTDEGKPWHFNTSVNSSYFKTVLKDLGYSSCAYVNPSSLTAYTYLRRDDDVFVFMGHGGAGRAAFYKEGNIVTGRILAHSNMGFSNPCPFYISDLNKNELCLNRCVIYLGCSTGTDYKKGSDTYNLVDATFDKGAHFVLGTTETLYTNQINDWLKYFLDAISEGMSISQAIVSANSELGTITVPYDRPDGTKGEKNVYGLPSYYCGDRIQYLDIN